MKDAKLFVKNIASIASGGESHAAPMREQFFMIWVFLMSAGAAVWLSICFVYGLWIPAITPAVYIVLTAANLWYYYTAYNFARSRFAQLFISLLLPFLFQWSLGGFVQSGAAILWAITAMFVSLTFQSTRTAMRWVVAFLVLAAVSGPIDGMTGAYVSRMPERFVTWLFVINIVGMTTVVFGLLWYFVRQREQAFRELTRTHIELVESQTRLVRAEKMASIGSLTAGIAHEMNNPVGVINSSAEVAAKCAIGVGQKIEDTESIETLRDDREFRRMLTVLQDSSRVVKDSSGRLKDVADRLKSFVRLDQMAVQETDLNDDLDNTIALLANALPERIEVIRRYGQLPRVTCQPGEINQVFMNVLQNAADAIEGPGTITVSTSVENERVVVRITDTGAGIPRERLDRLFDPGFSGKNGRVRAGMGLMVSQQIVTGHGGEIEVESELGKGTTVTIFLPADEVRGKDAVLSGDPVF
jgi:signal transduction histidine kinase